jgi:hypothetical protein
MWLLSVMTVTMVVGVCMLCACCARVCSCVVLGLGGGGVCCLGCVDACLAGADLDWSTHGADVFTGVARRRPTTP